MPKKGPGFRYAGFGNAGGRRVFLMNAHIVCIHEVNQRRARLVLGWVTVFLHRAVHGS